MIEIDKIDQIETRITQNLSDYHDHIKGFEKDQIIDMAGKISAMNDAHYYLTEHHGFTYEQAEYLLKFQNPLEIVADKWYDRISDISDMSFDIDKVFDRQDAEQDGYALMGADDPAVTRYEDTELKAAARNEVRRLLKELKGLDDMNERQLHSYSVKISDAFINQAGDSCERLLLDAFSTKLPILFSTMLGEEGMSMCVSDGVKQSLMVEHKALTQFDRLMAAHEFYEEMGKLLPGNSPVALQGWINFANDLEDRNLQSATNFYAELVTGLTYAKEDHGDEIAQQLFDIAPNFCIHPSTIRAAAYHLDNGMELGDVLDSALSGKLEIGGAEPKPQTLTDKGMTDQEFENAMNTLLPDIGPGAMQNWINYTNRIESDARPAPQFFSELAAEFTVAKQKYGEEIATQTFHIGLECCFPPSEVDGAANHLNHGVDIGKVVTLAVYAKLGDPVVDQAAIQAETKRIAAELSELTDPNSPDKSHFVVEISQPFLFHASAKDQQLLLNALSFKTAHMSDLYGERGVFVFVAKDELQKKPSILGKLADAQKEAAAQNQPGKDKGIKKEREEL